jgi:uncharacterized LabA/DUF88 family protein
VARGGEGLGLWEQLPVRHRDLGEEDRRMLTRKHVELVEIPQRMGATRKNAADINMAVDAVRARLCDHLRICTGDSDFTPCCTSCVS